MTLQAIKSEFRHYRLLEQELQRAAEETRRWQAKREQWKSGGRPKPSAALLARVSALEEQLQQRAAQLVEERQRVQAQIDAIPDRTLRLILEYHYIDGMTLEKIAMRLHYSYVHICRLHRQALDWLASHQEEGRVSGWN